MYTQLEAINSGNYYTIKYIDTWKETAILETNKGCFPFKFKSVLPSDPTLEQALAYLFVNGKIIINE